MDGRSITMAFITLALSVALAAAFAALTWAVFGLSYDDGFTTGLLAMLFINAVE